MRALQHAFLILINIICIIPALQAADNIEPPRKQQKIGYANATAADFISAIKQGDFVAAQQCINDGFDATARNEDGETVLHILAGMSYQEETTPLFIPDFINTLIKNRAPVNARTYERKETALHYAASSGNEEIAKYLLQNQADPDTPNESNLTSDYLNGDTPLHYAALENNTNMVQILIAHGADVATENADTFTPLHIAAENGFLDVMNLLIHNNAPINTPRIDITGTEQTQYAPVNNTHQSTSEHRKIITEKEYAFAWEITPLHVAAGADQVDAVQLLIQHNAAVDAKSAEDHLTPLHYFTKYGSNQNIAKVLLKNGADVNKITITGATPLHLLSENNLNQHHALYAIASVLFQYGANVNAQYREISDSPHRVLPAPLHTAVLYENETVARFLLMHGANPNRTNAENDTPLDIAYEYEDDDFINILETQINQTKALVSPQPMPTDHNEALTLGKYALGQNYINTAEYITNNINNAYRASLILHAMILRNGDITHKVAIDRYITNMFRQHGRNNLLPSVIQAACMMISSNITTTPFLLYLVSTYSQHVNAYRDPNNNTFFHYIAYDAHIDHILFLQEHVSARTLNVENEDGKTALDIAREINNTSFIYAHHKYKLGTQAQQTSPFADIDIRIG